MKIARHAQIIKLINQYDIETQEELAKKLEESGFAVTQATISRDIRQLKLTKVPKENGGSRYAVLQNAPSEVGSRYARVLKDAFISVDLAKNILVIKTVSGMAMAAAAALWWCCTWPQVLRRSLACSAACACGTLGARTS